MYFKAKKVAKNHNNSVPFVLSLKDALPLGVNYEMFRKMGDGTGGGAQW
jgi:hypothetical protein